MRNKDSRRLLRSMLARWRNDAIRKVRWYRPSEAETRQREHPKR